MKEFKLSAIDNTILSCYLWDDVDKPIGVIQIVHGSAEHMLRYDDFAKTMNTKGYVVIGDDHRGHGKTAQDNHQPFGFFDKHQGWMKIIDDEKTINDYAAKTYSDLPIFMLGHSMGSFMARNYAMKFSSTIDGLILTGTTDYSNGLLVLGKIAATLQILIGLGKKPAKFINYCSYVGFNKEFSKKSIKANPAEWHTTDPKVNQAFLDDPMCGFVFTAYGFRDMFVGMQIIKKNKNIKMIRKDLPILIASGLDDAVGNFGKGTEKVEAGFNRNGYEPEMILYPKLRHEILFEPEKAQVETDVLDFISRNIK